MSHLTSGRAKFLAGHDMRNLDNVLGVIENAQLTPNEKITATVRFSNDEISMRNFKKIQDGILTDVSIGYQVRHYEDVSKEGDEIPTLLATDYKIMEVSLVPIGFDPGATVREQTQPTNEVIVTRSITDKEAVMPNEIQPKDQPVVVDTEALKKEAVEAERTRSSGIRKAVREAQLNESLADDMIDRGLSLSESAKNIEAFKKAIETSKKTDEVSPTVRVEVIADDRDKKRGVAVEALLHRVDRNVFKPTQGNSLLGLNFLRMMESIVPRTQGMSDASYATRVMSSSDLPFILANVMEKAALQKYNIQPRTWSRWASSDTLRNYKTKDLVRSGDFSSLEERKENGEFKRGSFGEEREQVTLKDYGKILEFTRHMLINDDLHEIGKVSSQAGVAASRLENQLVYAQLTSNPTMGDGVVLFHSSHANLGSPAAISDVSIGEAFQLMREQLSVDGLDKLNLAPKYMICGPQSEVTARKYLAQISPTAATNVNVFSGSLELIIDSEISTNDFYFAADQSNIPTVVLYHLEGEENPRVENRINWETESVELKVAHAAVAKAVDYRGLVKNANAS